MALTFKQTCEAAKFSGREAAYALEGLRAWRVSLLETVGDVFSVAARWECGDYDVNRLRELLMTLDEIDALIAEAQK